MAKLQILHNLKKRLKFKYNSHVNFQADGLTSTFVLAEVFMEGKQIPKKLTVETEDAIYEYLFSGSEPLQGGAGVARPTRALVDKRDSPDPEYRLVEHLDRRIGVARGTC